MCEIANRTSAHMLPAAIMGVLTAAGMSAEVAEQATSDVLNKVAMSKISHPCWAAEILGVNDDDAEDKDEQDENGFTEMAPGVMVKMVKVGPEGVEEPSNLKELPPHLQGLVGLLTMLSKGRKPE